MAARMLMVARHRSIGAFIASPALLVMGWYATAVMAKAMIAMIAVRSRQGQP